MADAQTSLALTFAAPVAVTAMDGATAPEGFPYGTEKSEIAAESTRATEARGMGTDDLYQSDVRATAAPTSTACNLHVLAESDSVTGGDQPHHSPVSTATSTAEPAGLPPRRLDCCSRCFSDCEIAPRRRELYRRVDGRLLCRSCYAAETSR